MFGSDGQNHATGKIGLHWAHLNRKTYCQDRLEAQSRLTQKNPIDLLKRLRKKQQGTNSQLLFVSAAIVSRYLLVIDKSVSAVE